MAAIAGTYLRTKEDMHEDFLSKLGVSFVLAKAVTRAAPTMVITQHGNEWKIVTKSIFKPVELNFELGVPFEEISTDGRKCKTTITMEGGSTLIIDQMGTELGNKSVKIIRDFTDEGIYVQMICEDVISRQFYRRE